MSVCLAACRQPSPAMAHCPTCHRTFGGVTGFDAHRKDGHCLNPADLGYVERDGVWRLPMSDAVLQRLTGKDAEL